MPLEKKTLIMEGLKMVIGEKSALTCWARFHHLYPTKHGTCLEYIRSNSSQFDTFQRYTLRESQVWERYALMFAHKHQVQVAKQRYDLATKSFPPVTYEKKELVPNYIPPDRTKPASKDNPNVFP